jgi:hypothetical protein
MAVTIAIDAEMSVSNVLRQRAAVHVCKSSIAVSKSGVSTTRTMKKSMFAFASTARSLLDLIFRQSSNRRASVARTE